MAALHHSLLVDGHIVAQVVKAELVVRAVGDVCLIHGLALGRLDLVDHEADGQAEETVYLAHPLGVALGKVIVDRYNVHALAGQCVQIRRQGRDQRFAFAGLHLRDASLMQHNAADHLHAVVPHAQHAPRRLAARRKRLRQQVVERFAVLVTRLELVGLGAQLCIRQLFVLLLERVHLISNGVDLFQLMRGMRAKKLGKKVSH